MTNVGKTSQRNELGVHIGQKGRDQPRPPGWSNPQAMSFTKQLVRA